MNCPKCDGSGGLTCLGCNGSGEGGYDGSSCMTCGGSGEEMCDACAGTGERQDFSFKTTVILCIIAFIIGGCNPLFPLL